MIRNILHAVVRRPAVYDLVQAMVGARALRRRLAEIARALPAAPALMVDIGGGTGELGAVWPAARYVCLDIDMEKLAGFKAKNPDGLAVQGDATRSPVATGAVDLLLCTAVSHHLTDAQLDAFVDEAARVLRPGTGRLLFMDATWSPWRLPSRLLWRYDRGEHPRRRERLLDALDRRLTIERIEDLAIWHRYVMVVGRKRSQ